MEESLGGGDLGSSSNSFLLSRYTRGDFLVVSRLFFGVLLGDGGGVGERGPRRGERKGFCFWSPLTVSGDRESSLRALEVVEVARDSQNAEVEVLYNCV